MESVLVGVVQRHGALGRTCGRDESRISGAQGQRWELQGLCPATAAQNSIRTEPHEQISVNFFKMR